MTALTLYRKLGELRGGKTQVVVAPREGEQRIVEIESIEYVPELNKVVIFLA